MMREALFWWTSQMLDLLPAQLARPDPSMVGALLVEPLPSGSRLLRRRGTEETLLGVFDLPGDEDALAGALAAQSADSPRSPVLLRLPPEAALRRDVVLPLAAEAGLDRVLGYEMDRLTPFSAEETFFSWSVLRRDREAGRLHLRLSMVLRKPLLPLLGALQAASSPARAIEIPPGLLIPLARSPSASASRTRRLLAAAGVGCAVLALLAMVLPFALQSVAASRIDRRIDALQPRVAAVQALQRRVAGSTAGAELVVAERNRLGNTLAVLAALTRVLPDDTFLSDLTLRQGQLTVSGQSPQASKLIPAISADPAFSAPAFSAPVTRIEGQNTDLFSIRTGLAR